MLVDAPEGLHRRAGGQFDLLGAAGVRIYELRDVVDLVLVRNPGRAPLAVPLADFFPREDGVLLAQGRAAGNDCCGAYGASAQGREEHGLLCASMALVVLVSVAVVRAIGAALRSTTQS